MECIVKKTTELSSEEESGILTLFNAIFNKQRTSKQFRNQFIHNPLGYSYHSMIMDNGQIVGCDSYIPSYYLVKGNRLLFANSVDTMVSKPYRDFMNLYDMVTAVHNYMKEEGVVCVYGFPNDKAYPVYIKSKLMRDIGSLRTYCLPYRIGGVKPGLRMFNPLSILFIRGYVLITSLLASKTLCKFTIEKEAVSYNATRYQRLDAQYQRVTYKGGELIYKIMKHEGIRTAFLIDIVEKSALNFNRAVQYIIKKHHTEFDMLLYVGKLPFTYSGLMKVPSQLEPKNFYFTGEILRKDEISQEVFFNIAHWDINLSNYDLL